MILADLRTVLTPRQRRLAVLVLIIVALLLPWMPTYTPVRDATILRYLEAKGRSPAQLREREAAERRAASDRAEAAEREAARRQAEEEKRRNRETWAALATTFRTVDLPPLWEKASKQTYVLFGGLEVLAKFAARPEIYQDYHITPEEAATARPCADPASTTDLLNRQDRRYRNVVACAIYLSSRRNALLKETSAVGALFWWIKGLVDREADKKSWLSNVVAFVWLQLWKEQLRTRQDLTPLPELVAGDVLNPQLLGFVMAPGFAQWFYTLAEPQDRLRLSQEVYPGLTSVFTKTQALLAACRAAEQTDCLGGPPDRAYD